MVRIINLILMCCVFLTQNAISQNKDGEDYKKQMWETEAFKPVEIPEEYLSASCIILNRSYEFQVRMVHVPLMAPPAEIIKKTHQRVKILDRAGVEEFSTFSFEGEFNRSFSLLNSEENVYAGFKVIKSDGRETEVDINNLLVKDEAENKDDKITLNKISIPDLEVGDILDYYIVKSRLVSYNSYSSSLMLPQDYFLPDNYPIVHQTIILRGGDRWKLHSRSFNGAPQIEEYEFSDKEYAYYLEDKHRDGIKNEIWFNPYKELPFVKFQMRYNVSFSVRSQKNPLHNEVLTLAKLRYEAWRIASFKVKDIPDTKIINFRIRGRRPRTQDEKLMRIIDETKRYYLGVTDKVSFLNGTNVKDFSNTRMAIVLSTLLKKHKIPHSILITTDESEVMLEDAISLSDIIYVIRIDNESPHYISNLRPFTVLSDISPEIAGNKAYAYQVYPKVRRGILSDCTIPLNDHLANNSTAIINVAFSLDSLITHLHITNTEQNALRYRAQQNTITKFEFFDEYVSHFGEKEFSSVYSSRTRPSILRREFEKIEEISKEQIREREEYLKELIQSDYDLVSEFMLSGFEIIDMGLFNQGNEFIYSINGSVNDLISKVGPNYILEAGKLISSQVSLNEAQRNKRHYNIYNYNPRSFDYTITIQIPEGYRVKGLESFSTDVSSNVGGYKSMAVQEGDKIIITSNKYYAQRYSNKSLWSEYVPFIDAAFDISQKQLLIEKL